MNDERFLRFRHTGRQVHAVTALEIVDGIIETRRNTLSRIKSDRLRGTSQMRQRSSYGCAGAFDRG
ncbi:MAG: hypothetical protein E6575_13910, partial [Bradyrhizobium sp.]|nr:hypothetical protein [Bradyrhizobium sp.]